MHADSYHIEAVENTLNLEMPYAGIGAVDGVSVCIPCFNSVERLPETLRHLQKQKIPAGLAWEVVVIDNASTDDTANVAREIWAERNIAPLRIVYESRAGASHAVARGICESRHTLVARLDDDNWVCEDWIALVYEIMMTHSDVGACGGLGTPAFESEAVPEWFWHLQEAYAIGAQAEIVGYVQEKRPYLFGAGMSVRRSAWTELLEGGFEHQLTCRMGTDLSTGGDVELSYALQMAGWKLWYDPRLSFKHFIPNKRLTWNYLLRLIDGVGRAGPVLHVYGLQLSPAKETIGGFPFPQKAARRLRESWLYQLCVVITRLCRASAKLKGPNADRYVLQAEIAYVKGHLSSLFRNPTASRRTKRHLQKAGWRSSTERSLTVL